MKPDAHPGRRLGTPARPGRAVLATVLAMLIHGWALGVTAPVGFEEDFDDEYKPWKEIETKLPAAPQPGNLETLYVSNTTNFRFAVDRNSLSIDTDGVIRYTLVVTSDQGAVNISYEGIRCSTKEHKLYAFGRKDGSWSRSRRNAWEPVRELATNRQNAAMLNVACETGTPVRTIDELVKRLRNPIPMPPP